MATFGEIAWPTSAVKRAHGSLVDGNTVGALEHSVDHAAATTTPEDHGERPLQHFDGLRVIEVAESLDVVAHTVDEEIRRRPLAAESELIAMAFALLHRDAGDVEQRLAELVGGLILRHLLGDDAHRAGNVHDQSVGLGRGRRAFGEISVDPARAPVQGVAVDRQIEDDALDLLLLGVVRLDGRLLRWRWWRHRLPGNRSRLRLRRDDWRGLGLLLLLYDNLRHFALRGRRSVVLIIGFRGGRRAVCLFRAGFAIGLLGAGKLAGTEYEGGCRR
jgi:hypothetical protein